MIHHCKACNGVTVYNSKSIRHRLKNFSFIILNCDDCGANNRYEDVLMNEILKQKEGQEMKAMSPMEMTKRILDLEQRVIEMEGSTDFHICEKCFEVSEKTLDQQLAEDIKNFGICFEQTYLDPITGKEKRRRLDPSCVAFKPLDSLKNQAIKCAESYCKAIVPTTSLTNYCNLHGEPVNVKDIKQYGINHRAEGLEALKGLDKEIKTLENTLRVCVRENCTNTVQKWFHFVCQKHSSD